MANSTITLAEFGAEMKKLVAEIDTKMFAFCARNFQEAMQGVITSMREPGKLLPGYPPARVKWVSARQRRAFFATNGFGRGIPTKRTGKYNRGWTLELKRDETNNNKVGGTLTLDYSIKNEADYSKFVGGDINGNDQSPIHAGRWKTLNSVLVPAINDWVRLLPSRMSSVKLVDK